jgi:hypothetical protein
LIHLATKPTVSPWAIFFRACGAKVFDLQALLLGFPAVQISIAPFATWI